MKSVRKFIPGHKTPASQEVPQLELSQLPPTTSPLPSPSPRFDNRSDRSGSISHENILAMTENARLARTSFSSCNRQRRPSSQMDLVRAGPTNRMLPEANSAAALQSTVIESMFVVDAPGRVSAFITKTGKPPPSAVVKLAVPSWDVIPVQTHGEQLNDAAVGRLMRAREPIDSSSSMFVTVTEIAENTGSMYICSARMRCLLGEPPVLGEGMSVPASDATPGAGVSESWRFVVICSRLPYFQLFWQILDKAMEIERARLTEVLTGTSGKAADDARVLCRLVYQTDGRPCWLTTPELKRNPDKPVVRFTCKRLNTEFVFATVDNDVSGVLAQLSSISTAALLRAFSPEDLVLLIGAILMEFTVVVVGSQCGRVSALCIALMTLARPMTWSAACVPILPPSLHDMIDVPSGGIFGAVPPEEQSVSQFYTKMSSAAGRERIVFALVDSSHIHVHRGFPAIPGRAKFVELIARESTAVRIQSGQTTGFNDDTAWWCPVESVPHIAAFGSHVEQYIEWLVGNMRLRLEDGAYSETFEVTSRNAINEMTALFAHENRDFMRGFMCTQMYANYSGFFPELPAVDPSTYRDFIRQPL